MVILAPDTSGSLSVCNSVPSRADLVHNVDQAGRKLLIQCHPGHLQEASPSRARTSASLVRLALTLTSMSPVSTEVFGISP